MASVIPQWTVAGNNRMATFESEQPALTHAIGESWHERGAVLTMPGGEQYLVIKLRPGVDIVAQRRIAGG